VFKIKNKDEKGSILVFSAFVLLFLTILTSSYWVVIRINLNMLELKGKKLKAYYLARSGFEEVAEELKKQIEWGDYNNGFNTQWQQISGDTFYKASTESLNPLTHFEEAVTVSVKLVNEAKEGHFMAQCNAEVNIKEGSATKKFEGEVVRSKFNEIFILEIKEII
jgi:hypothetical protein